MSSLYLDTSAMVKRWIAEPGSEAVADACAGATCYTARYSAIEAESALSRREREGYLDPALAALARTLLDADFASLSLVELDADLVRSARALLRLHALRAGDALQLASCLRVRDGIDADVRFCAFDERLRGAARASGLRMVP